MRALFNLGSQRTDTLGGMSLKQIERVYSSYLYDDMLPFYDKYVIDHEKGGFMCAANPDGTRVNESKRAVYEGRGVWVYSYLYKYFTQDRAHLEVALKSANFLMKNKPEGDQMWPVAFDREGNPTTGPAATVNADMYIAEGFAELAYASGDDYWRELAIEIMTKCLRVYDRPDYGRPRSSSPDEPARGRHVMDDWMLFMSAATEMLRHAPDRRIEAIAKRCTDTITNNFYNPRYSLVNEYLEKDLSYSTAEWGQAINFGNSVQAIWHVMDEALRINDRELFVLSAERLRRHMIVAWDEVFGGFFGGLNNVDENTWRLTKAFHSQIEPLIGLMMVLEHTGDQWAAELFDRSFEYIEENFSLKKHGLPLWIVGSGRIIEFNPKSSRIENFHQPRYILYTLGSLQRMNRRGGRVSGVFS